MNPVEFLRHKRDAREHAPGELKAFIDAFVRGDVADYQASAWLMAAFVNGLAALQGRCRAAVMQSCITARAGPGGALPVPGRQVINTRPPGVSRERSASIALA